MDVEKYIEQQLHPEQIVDSAAETKLRELSVLNMTTAELYEKYLQPGQLLRQLQARECCLRKWPLMRRRIHRKRKVSTSHPGVLPRERIAAAATHHRRAASVAHSSCVYSERQLQEVMVDFWTNHFNIFANKGADRWLLAGTIATRFVPTRWVSFRRCCKPPRKPGDVVLSRQLSERDPNANQRRGGLLQQMRPQQTTATATATRHQRELRARADGAAHARRRWRLHAEGCAGSRALLHGLDHLQPRGGAANAVMGEAG